MRSRIAGTCLGVLALVSACATSNGTLASNGSIAPAPDEGVHAMSPAERDSLLAQTVADREGPAVDIRADVEWVANTRRVRARFNLHDDAYVLVGQIDPDGIVRVIFPTNPKDDGFARGDHSYYTPEVFAGFADQYLYRYSYTRYVNGGYSPYSYDGGLGFMFVIASWRPMHFDQLATDGTWDSYELANDDYLRDPRPAIYELASLLAGDNREAYTVKFAQYYNTELYGGYGSTVSSMMFNDMFCSGLGAPVGYYSSPFSNPIFASLYFGENFFYRGSYYQYSSLGDCYTTGIGNYINPFGSGYSPWGSPIPVAPRPGLISAIGHRSPPTPHPVHPPQLAAGGDALPHPAGVTAAAEHPHFNPEYRNRGLITDDNPAGAGRRTPGTEFHHEAFGGKPSIQEMVGRHLQDNGNGFRDWTHTQRLGTDNASAGQPYRAPTSSWDGSRTEPRGGSTWDGGGQMRGGGSPRVDAGPRSEPHYSAPNSQPHFSAPAAAPAVHSAPAPAPAAAASPSKPNH